MYSSTNHSNAKSTHFNSNSDLLLNENASLVSESRFNGYNNNDENLANATIYYERLQKLKNFPIPTNDKEVKIMLRELCEPIIYFGESKADRRERLQIKVKECILLGMNIKHPFMKEGEIEIEGVENSNEKMDFNKEYYTEVEYPEDLIKFRLKSTSYSIAKSLKNISELKCKNVNRIKEIIDNKEKLTSVKFSLASINYYDERGITCCDFNNNSNFIAFSGVSGDCQILNFYKTSDIDDINLESSKQKYNKENYPDESEVNQENEYDILEVKCVSKLIGHKEKVNCIKFNNRNLNSPFAPHLVTCSDDKTIKIWTFNKSLKEQKFTSLLGHDARVNKVDFCKIKDYIGSVSHDKTFKIWDLPTKKCIITQDGHISPITSLSFQYEGALAATCDTHGIGLIWDLRIGKKIMTLEGHANQIFSCQFNVENSYGLLTGGDDNTLRYWDLRKKDETTIIPAHNKPISSIIMNKNYSFSSGYDGVIKLWNNKDWICYKKIICDDEKIMSISMSKNKEYLASVSMSRSLRIWNIKGLKENQ